MNFKRINEKRNNFNEKQTKHKQKSPLHPPKMKQNNFFLNRRKKETNLTKNK